MLAKPRLELTTACSFPYRGPTSTILTAAGRHADAARAAGMVANALANRGAVLLKVAAIPASGASFSGQASR